MSREPPPPQAGQFATTSESSPKLVEMVDPDEVRVENNSNNDVDEVTVENNANNDTESKVQPEPATIQLKSELKLKLHGTEIDPAISSTMPEVAVDSHETTETTELIEPNEKQMEWSSVESPKSTGFKTSPVRDTLTLMDFHQNNFTDLPKELINRNIGNGSNRQNYLYDPMPESNPNVLLNRSEFQDPDIRSSRYGLDSQEEMSDGGMKSAEDEIDDQRLASSSHTTCDSETDVIHLQKDESPLPDIPKDGPVWIVNLHNTCYMSATFQCLFSLKEFWSELIRCTPAKIPKVEGKTGRALLESVVTLQRRYERTRRYNCEDNQRDFRYALEDFYSELREIKDSNSNQVFGRYTQEDAAELVTYILDNFADNLPNHKLVEEYFRLNVTTYSSCTNESCKLNSNPSVKKEFNHFLRISIPEQHSNEPESEPLHGAKNQEESQIVQEHETDNKTQVENNSEVNNHPEVMSESDRINVFSEPDCKEAAPVCTDGQDPRTSELTVVNKTIEIEGEADATALHGSMYKAANSENEMNASGVENELQVGDTNADDKNEKDAKTGHESAMTVDDVVELREVRRLTLQECIDYTFKSQSETLEYKCEEAGCGNNHLQRIAIYQKYPKFIFMQLVRAYFDLKTLTGIKDQRPIQVNDSIILPYGPPSDIKLATFKLRAAICHHGHSLNKGHYTAVVLNPPDSDWYICDCLNSIASIVEDDRERYITELGYCFFYEREDSESDVTVI